MEEIEGEGGGVGGGEAKTSTNPTDVRHMQHAVALRTTNSRAANIELNDD